MNKLLLLSLFFLSPLLSSAQLPWNDTMMVWFDAMPPVHLTEMSSIDNLYFVPGKTGDLVGHFGISGLNQGLGGMSIEELKALNPFFGTNVPVAIFADGGLNLWVSNPGSQARRLNPQAMPRRVMSALLGETSKIGIIVFTAGTRSEYLYDSQTGQFSKL